MKKQILSFVALMAAMKLALAGTVTAEKAKTVAQSFFNSVTKQNDSKRTTATTLKLAYTENLSSVRSSKPDPAYYIFNNSSGKGFVIVSGDDVVEPIIGYSLENTVDINNMPPNFLAFMESHKYAIQQAQTMASSTAQKNWNETTYAAKVIKEEVSNLLRTEWDQGGHYNDKCPKLGVVQRALVGCVAVAMGQVMRYWQYPNKGYGKRNGVDFEATEYDWENMPKELKLLSKDKQIDAVSTLLYHCGRSVDMDYGLKESSASTKDATSALTKYFQYSNDIKYVKKEDYSAKDWRTLLKNQLDDEMPVIYRGEDKKGDDRHAWVCSGYDSDDKFYMNWGWGGKNDGYYSLTDLSPGNNQHSFENAAVINIHRPEISKITSTKSTICKQESFEYSVKKDNDIVAVYWTVPKGWKVDGKESNGSTSIKADDKVKIDPSKDFDKKSEATIKAVGVVEHGEKTLPRYFTIATGIPSFTKDVPIYDIGSVLHCFTPSKGAIMQMLENGVWKNENCKENLNHNGKSIQVTVRATNTCGASASQKFDLVGIVDPDQKRTEISKNSPASSTLIYPNPATDLLFIQSKEVIKKIQCSNLMGQVFSVDLNNQEVNISNLPKGVYILTLTKEGGEISIHKFIKQ